MGLLNGKDSRRLVYIPFQIAVHYGEEDLEEEIDSIDEDCKQVEPCFA